MKKDFLNELSSKQKEAFFNDIIESIFLIKIEEFKHFSFDIDYEDPECQDFILRIQHFSPQQREEAVRDQGVPIIKKYFKYQKKKELMGLLGSIEEKYRKKDEKTSRAAYTALLLLEDKYFDDPKHPLLTALVSLELTIMEEEIFNDPTYFSNRGLDCLKNNQLEEAEKFFLLERQVDEEHWSSYENLADVYYKKGEKEKAVEQIEQALKRAYESWEKEQQYLDFEVVEDIEEKADEILNRGKENYLRRLSQYAYGLLYFLGTVPLDVLVREIKEVLECKKKFSKSELSDCLKKDNRLKVKGNLVSLKNIENPELIIEEVSRRKLKQRSPYSLSALKLAEEGRIEEFFFTDCRENEEVNSGLKRLTNNELNLVTVYEQLRKDIIGRKHHDFLTGKVIQSGNPHAEEILNIFSWIWNNLPRWEIGGHIASQLAEKREDEGTPPEPHTYSTSFVSPKHNSSEKKKKIGRNGPCPCGSGKKYKKCCGK